VTEPDTMPNSPIAASSSAPTAKPPMSTAPRRC
jgi:hypothetical protein